jgi:hypothetical protein
MTEHRVASHISKKKKKARTVPLASIIMGAVWWMLRDAY